MPETAGALAPWAKVAICICIWWTCAVAVTLGVKSLLVALPGDDEAVFPFPFALTALLNASTACFAHIIDLMRKLCIKCGVLETDKVYARCRCGDCFQLVLTGFLQGLEIACVNKALEYLTVAKRTMVMSTSLLFMMSIAVPAGLEHMTCGKMIAAVLLTIGGACQGVSTWRHYDSSKESSVTALGYVTALCGMVLSSARWALLQHQLQRQTEDSFLRHINKVQMLSYIMPVTAAVCILLAAVFEAECFSRIDLEVTARVLSMSSLLTAMVASELMFVQLTSAVAMNVAGQLHNIPIVLGGVFIFGEKVHPFAAVGFAVCIVGALLYTSESRRAAATNIKDKLGAEMVAQDEHAADQFVKCRHGIEDNDPFAFVEANCESSVVEVALELSNECQGEEELGAVSQGNISAAPGARPAVYGSRFSFNDSKV